MKDNIESMQKLINAFTYLPGVGRKTAERYAYSIISLSEEDVQFFADSLTEVKSKINLWNSNALNLDPRAFSVLSYISQILKYV